VIVPAPPCTSGQPADAAAATAQRETGQLLWRCRRGMKELDVLLERYARQALPQASAQERHSFAQLLGLPDPLLADYLLGGDAPAEPDLAHLVRRIRALCRLGDGSAVFCR